MGETDGGSKDVIVASCFTCIFVFHLSIIQPCPSHLQFMNFAQSKSLFRRHFGSITRLGGGCMWGGVASLIKAFKEQKKGKKYADAG